MPRAAYTGSKDVMTDFMTGPPCNSLVDQKFTTWAVRDCDGDDTFEDSGDEEDGDGTDLTYLYDQLNALDDVAFPGVVQAGAFSDPAADLLRALDAKTDVMTDAEIHIAIMQNGSYN